jgi:Icc-related predicted phosphoesterase
MRIICIKNMAIVRAYQMLGIKILFIADTHGMLRYEQELIDYISYLKNYDCCILLGDHSANDLEIIKSIIPQNKLYGVLGNHDGWNLYRNNGIEDINGKVIKIKEIKIAGIGGSFKYKESNDYAMYTHEESIGIADKMENADILISHDKPYTKEEYGESHDGLKGITYYIYKNGVPLHIHGHIHEESETTLRNGTKSVCLYKVKLLEL